MTRSSDTDEKSLVAYKQGAARLQVISGGLDPSSPLKGTTLLYLGRERLELPPYRIWSDELGGVALHVAGQYGLISWLERNIATKSLVIIDDDRFDDTAACELALEIRLMRPDVPVIIVVDDDDIEVPARLEAHSFALETRPMTLSSLHRAIAVSHLMVAIDDQRRPQRIAPQLPQRERLEEYLPFEDYMGRYTGWWNLPVAFLGIAVWLLFAYAVISGLLDPSRILPMRASEPTV